MCNVVKVNKPVGRFVCLSVRLSVCPCVSFYLNVYVPIGFNLFTIWFLSKRTTVNRCTFLNNHNNVLSLATPVSNAPRLADVSTYSITISLYVRIVYVLCRSMCFIIMAVNRLCALLGAFWRGCAFWRGSSLHTKLM